MGDKGGYGYWNSKVYRPVACNNQGIPKRNKIRTELTMILHKIGRKGASGIELALALA